MSLMDSISGGGQSQDSPRIPALESYFPREKCSEYGFTITADVNKKGFERETIEIVFCCQIGMWDDEKQYCTGEAKMHYVIRGKKSI